MNRKYLYASIVGIVPAILELGLVYGAEPKSSFWLLFQVSLFWFTCGFTNYFVNIKLNSVLSGIALTLFLSSPWFIAESVLQNKPGHFLPLVVASIIMGSIIGLLCKWLKKKEQSNS